MKTVNSLSGGKTSSFMAIHYPADINIFACVCIDYPKASPKDPEILKYCLHKLDGDFIASAESVKTLKILIDLEQKLGNEIVWVRGKSFDQIIDTAGCLPTWARRFCTTELKILPIFEYLYFKYGIVKEQIGFRFDESHRAYRDQKEETISELFDLFGDKEQVKSFIKKKYRITDAILSDYAISQNVFGQRLNNRKDILWAKKEYPMIDHEITLLDVANYWKHHPKFQFPKESNCSGCHHKSPKIIRNQFKEEPEVMEWFSLQEKKGKFNTWHDDKIPYSIKKNMRFSETLDFSGSGSCETGMCIN